MITRKIFALMFMLALLFLTYNGCSDSGNDPAIETGTMTLKLTDAPFPIELAARVEVTIDSIYMKSQGDIEGDSLILLSFSTQTYDLLDLRNGITETLAELEIPAGTYNQIRLKVVDAEIELTDGQVFNLNIPSGYQTGIKINIHPFLQIAGGTNNEILIDFDLEKSFVMRGNPNSGAGITGFNFKPVIRAVNNSDAGKIFGNVVDENQALLENVRVWVEQDSILSSTFTNELGDYALIGIPSGTYAISATMEGYDTVSVSEVTLQAGQQIHQNFQLTHQ